MTRQLSPSGVVRERYGGGRIVVCDYDPSWPSQFERERERLWRLLQPEASAIEHIGSTSVPGLAAKPIIDLLVGVRSLEAARLALPGRMAAIGYRRMVEYESWLPDEMLFRRGMPGPWSHHAHIVVRDSSSWEQYLEVREYLRRHPAVAAAYADLKRSLAAAFGDDIAGFRAAKRPFLLEVMQRARLESRRGARSSPGAAHERSSAAAPRRTKKPVAGVLTEADISYVKEQFLPLADLCRAAGQDRDEVRGRIATRQLPAPPYPGMEYVPADFFALPDADEFRRTFPGDDLEEKILTYLDGTYFICLRQATVANIVRKGELVTGIRSLIALPAPADASWRQAVRTSVDELDALERPFSPDYDRQRFGRPPTRDELIAETHSRFPQLWTDIQ